MSTTPAYGIMTYGQSPQSVFSRRTKQHEWWMHAWKTYNTAGFYFDLIFSVGLFKLQLGETALKKRRFMMTTSPQRCNPSCRCLPSYRRNVRHTALKHLHSTWSSFRHTCMYEAKPQVMCNLRSTWKTVTAHQLRNTMFSLASPLFII
jgi:hypothetical protein